MNDQARIHRFFSATNTGSGFVSCFSSALKGMEQVFVLKGAPGTGKSTILKSIGIAMVDSGFAVEYLHCSGDTSSLDGVIIPELRMAIIDGSAPHAYEPESPGVIDEIIHMGQFCHGEFLQPVQQEILASNQELDNLFTEVHDKLKDAVQLRQQIRGALGLDEQQVNPWGQELIQEIFQHEPVIRHLFASAITPRGKINFLLNITEPWSRRYIIKGPPGSGKSAILQAILQRAKEHYLNVNVYHDPLEVDRLEALVIPQLDLAVASIEPGEALDGLRAEDQIIDLSQHLDKQKMQTSIIATLVGRQHYQDLLQQAFDKLAEAKRINDKLEGYHVPAMDFDALDAVKEDILNKILARVVIKRNKKGIKV